MAATVAGAARNANCGLAGMLPPWWLCSVHVAVLKRVRFTLSLLADDGAGTVDDQMLRVSSETSIPA